MASRETLRVDTQTVRSLADNLHTVCSSLENAETTSETLQTAVGDDTLSSTLKDFSSKWERRREDLLDQIETLQKTAQNVAEGFENVDNELVKALTEEPSE